MKKIIFTLLALVGTMSMNAQVMKIMKGTEVVATYTADQADNVVFEEAPAVTTTGTAKRTGNIDVNWVQLWENGPKFAEYNVGAANNKAEDCGGYYCWGGTYKNGPDENGEYYTWRDDHNTDSSELSHTGDDITDTATKLWGSNWRMPRQDELQELLDNCDVVWTTVNGVNGRKFTGKGDYKSNSVFLPAAGGCRLGEVLVQGDYGQYWSSTPNSTPNGSNFVYDLCFNSGSQGVRSDSRDLGFSVRAVLKEYPKGALKGEFSVSATKKVYFSQGNLIATIDDKGNPTAWKFATNQYDYIGEYGANKTIGIVEGDVDLFGWSTNAASNNWGIHTKTTNTTNYTVGEFKNWGTAIDDKDTWRTLSKDEWTYLFNTTSRMVNSKPCYSNAVSGVSIGGTTYKGVFIYPDNYNGNEVSSSMTWDQINAAGIVFLPAAGRRDGSSVEEVGGYGYYWSSTAEDGKNAYRVYFGSPDVNPGNDVYRRYGCSVRLITESE